MQTHPACRRHHVRGTRRPRRRRLRQEVLRRLPRGCTVTPVAASGLKAALDAAQANGTDDRFFLTPGIYVSDKFSHQLGARVQIIGAGVRTTVPGDVDGSVLPLGENQDLSVSDLTLEPTGAASSGLTLQGTRSRGAGVYAKGRVTAHGRSAVRPSAEIDARIRPAVGRGR
jgi:hypothetical protein